MSTTSAIQQSAGERPDALSSRVRWAGLAGRSYGDRSAPGRSFVFLHGLTFDRHMWDPILASLPSGHQAIAFDLPGHGGSPELPRHDLDAVVDAIHDAVVDAGLDAPIVVGHSIAGGLASLYAVKHPAAAVVNVDAGVRLEPIARLVQSLAPQLTGDGFAKVWSSFRAGMHIELVPDVHQPLLQGADEPSQQLVLSYWANLLERSVDDNVRWLEERLSKARRATLPYVALYGNPVEPEEQASLEAFLPHASIVAWPVGHHFPHLADPVRFAELLTVLAGGLPVPASPLDR